LKETLPKILIIFGTGIVLITLFKPTIGIHIEFETLQQEVWNIFIATDGFYYDPDELEFSETTSTPENNPNDSDPSSEENEYSTPEGTEYSEDVPILWLPPEFDIFSEDLNLEFLFQQPDQPQNQPMAQPQQADFQNLTAALAALQAALPNTNQALAANTNAVNNPQDEQAESPIYLIFMEETKILSLGYKILLALVMLTALPMPKNSVLFLLILKEPLQPGGLLIKSW